MGENLNLYSTIYNANIGKIEFENVSVDVLDITRLHSALPYSRVPQLGDLSIKNCENLIQFVSTIRNSANNSGDFTDNSFKNIVIENCQNLMFIEVHNAIEDLQIINCPNITSLSGLKYSNIYNVSHLINEGHFNKQKDCYGLFRCLNNLEETSLVIDRKFFSQATNISSICYGGVKNSKLTNLTISNFKDGTNILAENVVTNSFIQRLTFENCYKECLKISNILCENLQELIIKDSNLSLSGISNESIYGNFRRLECINSLESLKTISNFSKIPNIEYISTSKEAAIAVNKMTNVEYGYKLHFYEDMEAPLYMSLHSTSRTEYITNQLNLSFIGRDISQLSKQSDVVKNYKGIREVRFVCNPNIAPSTGNFSISINIIGAKNVYIEDLNYWNTTTISIIASGAMTKGTIDEHMLFPQNMYLGDVGKVYNIYTQSFNIEYSDPEYFQELSFTNFGGKYNNSKLYLENLPALTQNCLTNIITNGIVNLAETEMTGNIHLCNRQMMNLTDSVKNLATEKGWIITEV